MATSTRSSASNQDILPLSAHHTENLTEQAQETPVKDAYAFTDAECGKYELDVSYRVEESCVMIGHTSPGVREDSAETLIEVGSTDFEIDISPENENHTAELVGINKELEDRIAELIDQNAKLVDRLHTLEEETTSKPAKNRSNTASLPTLYQQFMATKAQVDDLTKQCQELEAENHELTAKLERKDSSTLATDSQNQQCSEPIAERSPLRRSKTVLNSTTQSTSTMHRSETIPRSSVKQSGDFEAVRLSMAEKIVQQEEVIQKLKNERETGLKRLTELTAGLDGLETRFELRLTNYESEVRHKFENLSMSLLTLHKRQKDLTQSSDSLRVEIQRLVKSFPDELRRLTKRYHDMKAENQREKEQLEELLENKSLNVDEAKKQISAFSDEADQYKQQNSELKEVVRSLKQKVASMKTMRLIPDSGQHVASNSKELEAMRCRIEQLEKNLAEQQTMYENLLREKDEAEETMFSITAVREDRSSEELKKENKELRTELLEVSEKLVDLEEENCVLKTDIENQSDFFGQCLNLEEELEAQRRVNRGLEEHLTRRKRRIDSLQCELGKLRQHIGDLESASSYKKRSQENKTAASNRMEEMLRAERHYEELDKILSAVQSERDELLQSKAHLNKMMHSLIKENKLATRALNKLRRESPIKDQQLEAARAEAKMLHARLKVEALARQHSGKSHASTEVDEDIMSRLVASQVALAEMDERMIKIRKELHRSVARNAFLTTKVTRLEKQLQSKRH